MKRETAPRFAGIGGHHSHKAGTVEWLTPPDLIAELVRVYGRPYGIDPCAAIAQPWQTALRMLTRVDNGLNQNWGDDSAYVNPPYTHGVIERWLNRLADHGNGMGLIFARTETDAFFEQIWNRATALLFMRGRINFHFGERYLDEKTGKQYEIGDRAPGNAGGPTVLCAYGMEQADVLAACRIEGRFVPLRIPRSVLATLFLPSGKDEKEEVTWRDLIATFFSSKSGPIALDEVYRALGSHPKSSNNQFWREKIRQQLQLGPYENVGRGQWAASA